MAIYTSEEDYYEAFEKEFQEKVELVGAYYDREERTTLDGEWTFEDLKDDLWDIAKKVLRDEGYAKKYECRVLRDADLLHEEFLVEDICSRYDLIEVYNRASDKHRNDKKKLFGIHYFDDVAKAEVLKTLKENLLTG